MDNDCDAAMFDRVPNVAEDRAEIRRRNVLVDGDRSIERDQAKRGVFEQP
jgi:hypothetical protein